MDTYSKYKDAFKYAPGSAAVQKMVGDSIDKSIEEGKQKRKDAEERAANRRKSEILNYSFAKQKAKDLDDLNVMGDTASTDYNEMLTTSSRQIADYAGYLNKELKRTGDYDTYAIEMAKLKTQVGALKNVKTGVNEFLNAYQTGKIDNSLSGYNSEGLIAMAEDMLDGSPGGGWQNIDGQQVWVGETVQGEPYKVSASEFQNLSKRLQKKEDIDTLIKGAIKVNTGSDGNILSFDQAPAGEDGTLGVSASDVAGVALDNLIKSTPGNKDQKVASLLVDHFGYSRKEADALANQPVEDDKGNFIGNRAEEVLEGLWLDRARSMYGINQTAVNDEKRRKQDQYYQHQKQAAMNLEFKRNQQETIRAFNDPIAAVWNQDMTKFKSDSGAIENFNGLLGQWQADLSRIGLTAQKVKLADDTVVPARVTANGAIDEQIIKGKPQGIMVQNPSNIAGAPIYIPFNASPEDVQNLIRQAQGLQPVKGVSAATNQANFQLNENLANTQFNQYME